MYDSLIFVNTDLLTLSDSIQLSIISNNIDMLIDYTGWFTMNDKNDKITFCQTPVLGLGLVLWICL